MLAPSGVRGAFVVVVDEERAAPLLEAVARAEEPREGVFYLLTGAAIRGELTLDGVRVDVTGSTISSKNSGAGFSFSFTSL